MENFTKGSLTQNGSGMWRKLGGALLGLVMLFAFASSASAQVFHTEDFQGATLWGAAGLGTTTNLPCESTRSVRGNIYSGNQFSSLVSPLLGTSNGLQVTMSF
ncbi:MAG: hypothetical protein ACI9UR_002334, partial [Bacteroidia bacterium]